MKLLSMKMVSLVLVLAAVSESSAQQSFTPVSNEVNKKMVKLFGAGGFKGLPSYGTGIVVSPQGHILTVNNHILTTVDLRVHLYDGRLYRAKVMAREPGLDVSLIKITEQVLLSHYFDFDQAAKNPVAAPGDWILAFSNQFLIGTRDDKMTVQKGVVAALTELRGRKGVFEAPYNGEVYFCDQIICNPGAAGGCITNINGELLGVIGRELKNTLANTWINYAVPIQATTELVRRDKKDGKDKTFKVNMAMFVRESISGTYVEGTVTTKAKQPNYTGITLVANAVRAAPPYVEEVSPGSPAAEAGLRPDDLIIYLNGEIVPTITIFRSIMDFVVPGTEVILDVQRRELVVGADGQPQRQTKLIRVKLKVLEQPKVK